MGTKRFTITESEIDSIKKLYMIEQSEEKEDRKFCHGGNVKTLDDIMGDDESEDYIDGVTIRRNGVNGLVDKLMNHIKGFKPYNYFDETKKECNKAMDKIIELYKENEHGEELVKDIEKVYMMNHVSARAKEFLKHGISMIKGQ
jgi:hypothetical protein